MTHWTGSTSDNPARGPATPALHAAEPTSRASYVPMVRWCTAWHLCKRATVPMPRTSSKTCLWPSFAVWRVGAAASSRPNMCGRGCCVRRSTAVATWPGRLGVGAPKASMSFPPNWPKAFFRCAPDQERRLIEREEAQALWHAVGELPPKFRAAVHLFYVEGLSCEETARALGVTVSTVTTRLTRARKQLERSLKGRLS